MLVVFFEFGRKIVISLWYGHLYGLLKYNALSDFVDTLDV